MREKGVSPKLAILDPGGWEGGRGRRGGVRNGWLDSLWGVKDLHLVFNLSVFYEIITHNICKLRMCKIHTHKTDIYWT